MSRRRALMVEENATIPIVVPATFRQLKYVVCAGQSYINALSIPISNGSTIYAKAEQVTADTSQSRAVCGGGNNDVYIAFARYNKNGNVGASYGTTLAESSLQNAHGTPVEFTTIFGEYDLSCTVKNKYGTAQQTTHRETKMSSSNMFRIGYYGTDNSKFTGNIWRIWIRNSQNVLVRDWWPAVRKSDSKVGLYDIVNGLFWQSDGTAFSAGPDV